MVNPTPLYSGLPAEERAACLERLLEEEKRAHAATRESKARLREELTEALQRCRILTDDATKDRLTGLSNRAVFDDQLELRRHIGPFSLVIIDIDHFKQVNDRYGHPVGDRMLHRFGQLLQAASHENDICARIGGEEFAVILCDDNEGVAKAFAERLKTAVHEGLAVKSDDGQVVRATVSIGAGEYRGEGLSTFVGRIDKALYAAKHAGRDCIRFAE